MAQITLKNIVKEYGDGFKAVNDINLDIADGEFMIFVGPSAAASRRPCAWSSGWRTSPPGTF